MKYFHFPKNLKDIFIILITIFFVGLIPFSLFLNINIYDLPIIRDFYNTPAWSYLLWWIGISVTGGTTFLGIWVAIEFNRREESRKDRNKVLRIFPYVYFELAENFLILRDTPINEYESKFIRLKDTFWNIYKNEISKWVPINVVNLTKLYYDINRFNDELNQPYSRLSDFPKIITESNMLILECLERYDQWIKITEEEQKYFKTVLDEYKRLSEFDLSIRKTIDYIYAKNLFNINETGHKI